MGRAIIYRRVSTEEQFELGCGLEAQTDACIQYAGKHKLEVVGPFDEKEGLSGSTPMEDCPGLMEALSELRRGDVLLVQKRDRLARNRLKIALLERELAKKRIRIVSATGEGTEHEDPNDPSAWMLRNQIDTFAEFEVMMARWRTKDRLKRKRAENRRTGGIPYGWDLVDDGRRSNVRKDGTGGLPVGLVVNKREQEVLRDMRRWRKEGWSLREIQSELNRLGIKTKAGARWASSSVAWVLAHTKEVDDGQATQTPGQSNGG